VSTRARVLALCAAGALLLALPLAARGLRWPPPQWSPAEPRDFARAAAGWSVRADGAGFLGEENGVLVFRAFVPEPALELTPTGRKSGGAMRVRLENVHVRAQCSLAHERPTPTTMLFEWGASLPLAARVQLPAQPSWRVAALGDTGAGPELDWFLARAAAVGADFALHLGDLAYDEHGIARAAAKLRSAPVPTFTAIGNHDFHDGLRLLHDGFMRGIGPLNSAFSLGGVRFLNLDTAADTWPAGSGARGRLLAREAAAPPPGLLVVMTHRPLVDPRTDVVAAGRGHGVDRAYESAWLRTRLRELGADLLLHGHVHTHIEAELDGASVRIVGGGLGLDLAGRKDPDARFLLLEWSAGDAAVRARWEPLGLPD
jgi:predicted phosphodiesterase